MKSVNHLSIKGLMSAVFLTALVGCVSQPTNNTSTAKSDESSSGLSAGLGALGNALGVSPSATAAAMDLAKAATVTDAEVKSSSLQYRQYEATQVKIASSGNKYGARLARLTSRHTNEDGLKLNFKAILDPSVNANATADGSVRVYSGLMDLMNDQELLGVIGHEIGHVKLGHTLSKTRSALLASATRKAAASSSNVAGLLAKSELGGFGEKLFNSQFSQSAETESDDYGLAFMKKHKYNVKAMESAFRKLAAGGAQGDAMSNMLSSHPDPAKRADRMRDLASAQ